MNHIVTSGESLWSLARKYATTPKAIAVANHLPNQNLIQIGLALRIPGALAMPSGTVGGKSAQGRPAFRVAVTSHAVGPGENLGAIAARYGVSTQAVIAANTSSHPNLLRVGQVLKIPVTAPTTVESLLVHYSTAYGVDPALMKALAWQESGWQQSVVSSVGAVGVMQIMPQTTVFTATNLLHQSVDPGRVESNIQAGVAFFAYLLNQAHGNQPLAVAGYYQGLRSVLTRGMYADTKRYVANIQTLTGRFR